MNDTAAGPATGGLSTGERFAMTPLDLLAHPDVSSHGKVLYGWLHGRYSQLPDGITAGVPRLAADLSWTEKRVTEALRELREVGAIKRRRRQGTSTRTVLVWHESRRRLRVVPDPNPEPEAAPSAHSATEPDPVTTPASCSVTTHTSRKVERASKREEDQDQVQDTRSCPPGDDAARKATPRRDPQLADPERVCGDYRDNPWRAGRRLADLLVDRVTALRLIADEFTGGDERAAIAGYDERVAEQADDVFGEVA